MCEPTTLAAASLAMTVVSAGVGYMGQQQQYKTTMALEKARHDASVVSAFAAARDEQRQLTVRQAQEQDAAGYKIKVQQLDEAEAKADAKVKSVSSSVTGLSIDGIIADLGGKAARNREMIRVNADNVALQLQQEQDATLPRAQSRIYMPGVATKPSLLTPILQIAGAGVSYGRDLNTIKRNNAYDARYGIDA